MNSEGEKLSEVGGIAWHCGAECGSSTLLCEADSSTLCSSHNLANALKLRATHWAINNGLNYQTTTNILKLTCGIHFKGS